MALSDLRAVAASGTHTRYIVLDEDGNQPAGFVHAKDILQASETEAEHDSITARDLARDILVVLETRRIEAILAEFQSYGDCEIAVVIDEWGAFEGIATIEDILEEIVGDIRDEFDTAPQGPDIEQRDDGTYVVDGGVPGQDVNERLGATFETEWVETVGGFVFSQLGRGPEVGDHIDRQGYVPRVDAIDNARIERLVNRFLMNIPPLRSIKRGKRSTVICIARGFHAVNESTSRFGGEGCEAPRRSLRRTGIFHNRSRRPLHQRRDDQISSSVTRRVWRENPRITG
jgi:Mg2+/Co2+ transporter CorC